MTRMSPPAPRRIAIALTSVIVGAFAGACEPPVKVRGHLPDPEIMAKIEPGEHGQSDVVEMLGSPSTASSFGQTTWYYIGSKEEQIAFFRPEVLKRNVFAVTFTEGDTVKNTRLYTQADGRPIDPVDRITPAPGRDLTLLQQLLGNLGRFNTQGSGQGSAGTPSPGPQSPSPLP